VNAGPPETEPMKNKERPTISRTKRTADLRHCARLMAATEPWLTLGLDYGACLRSVSAPLREVYAARGDGGALGFIVLQMTGTFKGYIQTVCVAPEGRGLGIGTRLIKFAERRIFKETPNVFMCVSSFNRGARKLYKKLGYVKTGILRDFIVKGHDELLLRKTRGPLRRAGRTHG
jgi:[ribosomal protein S18]-alanine N-acetyltransferase